MKIIIFFSATCLLLCVCKPADKSVTPQEDQVKSIGSIIVLDQEFNGIIDSTAKIEVLAEGFDWSEGPLWLEKEGCVIFSDVPKNTIYKWKEREGKSVYLTPSGYTDAKERGGETGSNGLLLGKDGKLVLCQHGDRRMARMESPLDDPKPDFVTIADQYNNQKFNSPNDAAYSETGILYFTDPPYGLERNMDDESKEIPFQGVYKVDLDGKVSLLTKKLSRPNGIAFLNPWTLLVANSDGRNPVIMEYKLDKEGMIHSESVFFDFTHLMGKNVKGSPDGLKVGKGGYVFATGPGGIHVFTPKAKHLGTIAPGEATSNCALDAKEEYLYATADMYLVRIKLRS